MKQSTRPRAALLSQKKRSAVAQVRAAWIDAEKNTDANDPRRKAPRRETRRRKRLEPTENGEKRLHHDAGDFVVEEERKRRQDG